MINSQLGLVRYHELSILNLDVPEVEVFQSFGGPPAGVTVGIPREELFKEEPLREDLALLAILFDFLQEF